MAIRDKGRGGTPGQELKNFTDREDELAIFDNCSISTNQRSFRP